MYVYINMYIFVCIYLYIFVYVYICICIYLHCKFRRVVLTPRGHFRPFRKRVVSTPRKGRFNSKGSFDSMEGS